MSRMLTQMTAALSMIAAIAAVAPNANAGHQTPVECAADRYRVAVVRFESHLHRQRYISHCDRRLVDDLEDSTIHLRIAARDCRRPDRLFARFAETDALHCRVERVLFGAGHYPPDPALQSCWSHVAQAHRTLAREIRALQSGRLPGAGHHLGHHLGHHGVPAPIVTKPRFNPDPFYRSEFNPTFRAETFGRRPELDPRQALSARPPIGSAYGAQLQRRYGAPVPAQQYRSSRSDLAAALIGAFLQRAVDR